MYRQLPTITNGESTMRLLNVVHMNTIRLHRRVIAYRKYILVWLTATACCSALGEVPSMNPPPHWFISGERAVAARKEYAGSTDHAVVYEGSGSGLLESLSDTAQHGTLMQVSSASAYRGKRIRFSAFLRGDAIAMRAGLWIRADDIDGTTVAFRNCYAASTPKSFVQGTTDWKEVEILIDIPDTAVDLSFGVLLGGTGKVWIDNASIAVIGPYDAARADQVERVPHNSIDPQKLSTIPQNMDFEQ